MHGTLCNIWICVQLFGRALCIQHCRLLATISAQLSFHHHGCTAAQRTSPQVALAILANSCLQAVAALLVTSTTQLGKSGNQIWSVYSRSSLEQPRTAWFDSHPFPDNRLGYSQDMMGPHAMPSNMIKCMAAGQLILQEVASVHCVSLQTMT